MEEGWSNDKRLAAAGWVVREGRDKSRRSVRVVLVDDEDGQARALKTTLLDREDVSRDLNKKLGDAPRYRNAGFTASLDVAAADPPIRPDRKSVVSGKSVSLRIVLGGRRIHKKKK